MSRLGRIFTCFNHILRGSYQLKHSVYSTARCGPARIQLYFMFLYLERCQAISFDLGLWGLGSIVPISLQDIVRKILYMIICVSHRPIDFGRYHSKSYKAWTIPSLFSIPFLKPMSIYLQPYSSYFLSCFADCAGGVITCRSHVLQRTGFTSMYCVAQYTSINCARDLCSQSYENRFLMLKYQIPHLWRGTQMFPVLLVLISKWYIDRDWHTVRDRYYSVTLHVTCSTPLLFGSIRVRGVVAFRKIVVIISERMAAHHSFYNNYYLNRKIFLILSFKATPACVCKSGKCRFFNECAIPFPI